MSWLFLIESLKFHKLKSELSAQLMFLLAFFSGGAFEVLFRKDFIALAADVEKAQLALNNGDAVQIINLGNRMLMNYLPLYAALTLLVLLQYFIMVSYSTAYVENRFGNEASFGVKKVLRKFFPLMLFFALMLLIFLFSSPFMLVPFLVLLPFVIMVPLYIAQEGSSFGSSFGRSIKLLRGRKLALILTVVMQYGVISLFSSMLLNLIPDNTAVIWLQSFITAVQILMQGRLLGIFYYFFHVQLGEKSLEEYLSVNNQEIFK